MSTPPLTDERVNTEGTVSDRRPLNLMDMIPKKVLVWALPGIGTVLLGALATVNELRESRLARMDEDGREIRREVPRLREDVNALIWRMDQHVKSDEDARQERRAVIASVNELRDEVLRLALTDAIERGDDRAARRISGRLKAIESQPKTNGGDQ